MGLRLLLVSSLLLVPLLAGCAGTSAREQFDATPSLVSRSFSATYNSEAGEIQVTGGPVEAVMDRDGQDFMAYPLRFVGAHTLAGMMEVYWLDADARIVRDDDFCLDGTWSCGDGSLQWHSRGLLAPHGFGWVAQLEADGRASTSKFTPSAGHVVADGDWLRGPANPGWFAAYGWNVDAIYDEAPAPLRIQHRGADLWIRTAYIEGDSVEGAERLEGGRWVMPPKHGEALPGAADLVDPWPRPLGDFMVRAEAARRNDTRGDGDCLVAASLEWPWFWNSTVGSNTNYRAIDSRAIFAYNAPAASAVSWQVDHHQDSLDPDQWTTSKGDIRLDYDCDLANRVVVPWGVAVPLLQDWLPVGVGKPSFSYNLWWDQGPFRLHSPAYYWVTWLPEGVSAGITWHIVVSPTDGLPLAIRADQAQTAEILANMQATLRAR